MPATAELAERWYGRTPPFTFRGWFARKDDELLGCAGVYWVDGAAIAFSEWRPARLDLRVAARAVRLVLGLVESLRTPVYAVCGTEDGRLLRKLGWKDTGDEALGGPLMIRQPGGA